MRAGGKGARGGLALRVAMASALLSLLIGGAFAFLVSAVVGMRDTAALARETEEVLASANDLERLVIDLETGQRGFQLTGDEAFLQPWIAARASFDGQAAELKRLAAAHHVSQAGRAEQIAREGASYIRDYSVPVVREAQQNLSSPPSQQVSAEGKQRMDRLRVQFREFVQFERGLAPERDARSSAAAHRAVLVSVGGIGGSILLIVVFSGYLIRSVVRPVRRASIMAGEVARGDLSVRMPETGSAEIGGLQRSFNTMAGALERNRDELTASRARIVEAGDAARRCIERDLHDGTQQRLVTIGLELGMAETDVPPEQVSLKSRLSWSVREVTDVIRELRETARGIHPATLSRGGLRPALATLARRSPVPVDLRVHGDRRLEERIEVAVYYVVCEALTNAVKHARASEVCVEVTLEGDDARLLIRDDGVGGADPNRGSGLIGLCDRVEALGGTVQVISPVNTGTTLVIHIPGPTIDLRKDRG